MKPTNDLLEFIDRYITNTCICLFKYTENFTTKKGKFSNKKNSDIFHVSAQNIDCGYSLEPSRRAPIGLIISFSK